MHDAIGLKERESRLLGVAFNQMVSEQVLILRLQLLLSPLQGESHKPACRKQEHTCKCFHCLSAPGDWELCPFQQTAKLSSETVPTYPAPFLHLESNRSLGADKGDKRANTKEMRGRLSRESQSKDQISHGKYALTLSLEDESPGFLVRRGYFFLCGHNG